MLRTALACVALGSISALSVWILRPDEHAGAPPADAATVYEVVVQKANGKLERVPFISYSPIILGLGPEGEAYIHYESDVNGRRSFVDFHSIPLAAGDRVLYVTDASGERLPDPDTIVIPPFPTTITPTPTVAEGVSS